MVEEKEETNNIFKDDRIQWILAASDDEVLDGIYFKDNERDRFIEEVNPDGWNIADYVDSLEETNNNYSSIVTGLEEDMGVLKEECEELLIDVAELEECIQEQEEDIADMREALEVSSADWNYAIAYPVRYMLQTLYYKVRKFINEL